MDYHYNFDTESPVVPKNEQPSKDDQESCDQTIPTKHSLHRRVCDKLTLGILDASTAEETYIWALALSEYLSRKDEIVYG